MEVLLLFLGRFYVGQNLGWSGSTASSRETDWNGIIQRWFNEHKDFKYPSTSKGVTGHYTQVDIKLFNFFWSVYVFV